jgi:hypothetical protein
MKTPQIKWSCSLSNGETLYEGKGAYEFQENTLSPYNRLLQHIEKQGLEITSLSLYTDENQRWNLPSAGNNPRFSAFLNSEKPISYKFFRRIGATIGGGSIEDKEQYAVIEAVYRDKILQTWVKEDSLSSWSLIL